MVNFFLLVTAIIVSAVLMILSFVFAIIYFVNSKKGKFVWLGAFLFFLAGLILSIYFTVNTAVNKAKSLVNNMGESFITEMDSTAYRGYNFADSLKSEQIKYLRISEPSKYKGTVPDQFYNYLGFKDYYRLPLVYPFSLHCNDEINNGSLYNEVNVNKFDESDNGETDCNLGNITEFTFDKNLFLAKQFFSENNKEKNGYVIYYFSSGKKEEYNSFNEFATRAKTLGYARPVKLYTCEQYYKLF